MSFFKKVRAYVLGEDKRQKTGDDEFYDASSGPPSPSETPRTGGSSAPDSGPTVPRVVKRAVRVPVQQPVVQSAQAGEAGGVQGLGWYQAMQKQDADGDLADAFLEEPQSRPQPSPAKQSQRQQQQQHLQALQAQQGCLKSAAGSDMIVENGNVFVVPPE